MAVVEEVRGGVDAEDILVEDIAEVTVLLDNPDVTTESEDILNEDGKVGKSDTDLIGDSRQPQAELTREGLPPQPSSQVGVAPARVCMYVGQKVVAKEKYRGSARFLKQLSSLQRGSIGKAVSAAPKVVAD